MERTKIEEWAERLAAAKAKGQTLGDVARDIGMSEATVHKWSAQVRKAGKNKLATDFVKIERGVSKPSSRGITIEIGNARIRVDSVADIALATALMRALGVSK